MKINVIGVGDTGCRIVNKIAMELIGHMGFFIVNAGVQLPAVTQATIVTQIGGDLRNEIKQITVGTDMAFIVADMGECKTSSMKVIAEIAKRSGALTMAIVTTPFSFEGKDHSKMAKERIKPLLHEVDSLFVIHNDCLLHVNDHKISVDSALWVSDEVVRQSVRAIAEVITVNGLIQLDFTDVKAVTKNAGHAWMSVGRGTGNNRAFDAVKAALDSPLLDVSIHGTKAVLFKVIGGADLTLYEVNQAAEMIKQSVDPEANIFFGVARDLAIGNEVRITLIGTGC